MNQDERNRPWLYAQRQDDDDRYLGLPRAPRLWPTILLAVVLGLVVASLGYHHAGDPVGEAIRQAIAHLRN